MAGDEISYFAKGYEWQFCLRKDQHGSKLFESGKHFQQGSIRQSIYIDPTRLWCIKPVCELQLLLRLAVGYYLDRLPCYFVRGCIIRPIINNVGSPSVLNFHWLDRGVRQFEPGPALACFVVLAGCCYSLPEFGFWQLRLHVQSISLSAHKRNASVFGWLFLHTKDNFLDCRDNWRNFKLCWQFHAAARNFLGSDVQPVHFVQLDDRIDFAIPEIGPNQKGTVSYCFRQKRGWNDRGTHQGTV